MMTDVGLPVMDGRELATQARMLRPELPILFASGYAEHIDVPAGMQVIGKPFPLINCATRSKTYSLTPSLRWSGLRNRPRLWFNCAPLLFPCPASKEPPCMSQPRATKVPGYRLRLARASLFCGGWVCDATARDVSATRLGHDLQQPGRRWRTSGRPDGVGHS